MTENTPTPAELVAEADALSPDSVMNDPHEALSVVRRLVRALDAQIEDCDALAAILAEAPHDRDCRSNYQEWLRANAYAQGPCDCWKSKLPADALAARDAQVRRDGFVSGVGAAAEAAGAYFGSRVVNQYGPNIVEGTWEGMEAAFAKVLNRIEREAQ